MDISKVPVLCVEADIERPKVDLDGEPDGTEMVRVKWDYVWIITVGRRQYHIRQDINPFSYEASSEEELAALNTEKAGELTKVDVRGNPGAVRYAGTTPRSICAVPKYLLDRWNDAGVLRPKLVAKAIDLQGEPVG